MRFTKFLREYVEEELNAKRAKANENDPLSIAYKAEREKALEEVEAIVERARVEVDEVLKKYDMENMQTARGYNDYHLVSYYDGYIGNLKRSQEMREREHERYEKQKKAMKEIEVNCTLGADRAEFMQMLSEVSF